MTAPPLPRPFSPPGPTGRLPDLAASLGRLPLFRRVPAAVWSQVAPLVEDRTCPPGVRLAEAGAPATHLVVIVEGQVRTSRPDATGEAATIDVLGPGAVVGECALGADCPHPLSAETLEPSRVLLVPGTALRHALAGDVAAVTAILGALSGALRGLLAQVNDLKLRSATQRLGMFLLQLAGPNADGPDANESADGPGVVVTLPYAKRLVADKLGMTPETLSRALARLAAQGVQPLPRGSEGGSGGKGSGQRIRLKDPGLLAAFCDLGEAGDDGGEERP